MSAPRELRGIRKLTDAEKAAISSTIAPVIKDLSIAGICAYGSQVAGYARPDSDYDLIIAASGYSERIRYAYLNGEVEVSALLIDSNLLLKDAEKATLGEFAVGRFLNVYEPISGAEYFDKVESTYKRRVALEVIAELVGDYGDFSKNLVIPVEYLLYQKLKKRAAIYPPALYSYVKTYSGEKGRQNLEFACSGFFKPLQELSSKDLINLEDSSLMITGAMTKNQLARLQALVALTERSVRQYAAHGYAGRVKIGVVRKELLSKISRSREINNVPEPLKKPNSILRLGEGTLIMDGKNWLKYLLEKLAFGENAKVSIKNVGGPYALLQEYRISEGDRSIRLAVKKYRDLKSVKWVLLNVWTASSRKFEITPLARLHREYTALKDFRKEEIDVPEIIAVIGPSRILVTSFIDGIDLGTIAKEVLAGKRNDLSPISMYGKTLARVHSLGYALGDAKPNNALLSDSHIYLTDFEQTRVGGDRAWDISVFIYYSLKLSINGKSSRDFVRAFLEGYLEDGSREIVFTSLKAKYYEPFFPILAPNVVLAARDEIAKALSKTS